MDITIFEPHELPVVLGALRDVARCNCVFTPAEAALVEGLAELHGQRWRANDVPHVGLGRLARVVVAPHRRKRVVQLAIIMSLVEGPPSDIGGRAVYALARALDVSDEGVRVLDRIAHHHGLLARFDMLRRVKRFVDSRGQPGALGVALSSLVGLGLDPELTSRYRALAQSPRGSLGHALFQHFRDNDFAFPGERGGPPESLLFHDVGHVVAGYGVDPQGEIQQAAFQAGFCREDGFVFLLFGILQFHLGMRITPVAAGQQGLFDVPKVLRALARGAACRIDFSNAFDFFSYADAPLIELRKRWGVPDLDETAAVVAA